MSYRLINRLAVTLLALLVCGVSLSSCLKGESYKVCILQWGEANAYDRSYSGLMDGLAGLGYREGQNIKIEHVVAKGDYELAKNTVSEWLKDDPSIIVTIGTKASLAAKEVLKPQEPGIPMVFTACAFPYLTGILDTYGPHKWITGVGAEIPVSNRVALLLQAFPRIKVVGIPYFNVNPQAVITAEETAKKLNRKGVNTILLLFNKDVEAEKFNREIEKLADRCDLIYMPTDPVLYRSRTLKTIISTAMKRGKPVAGVTLKSAQEGAVLAYYSDFYEGGREAASMVDMVLNGKPVESILPHPTESRHIAVNIESSNQLGITLPRSILAKAKKLL